MMQSHQTRAAARGQSQHNSQAATFRSSPKVRDILDGSRVQTKLKIGAANDPAEREADRVADQVMRMAMPAPEPDAAAAPTPPSTGSNLDSGPNPIRRMCTECEDKLQRKPIDEEDDLEVQRMVTGAVAEVDEEELVRPKEAPGAAPALSTSSEGAIRALRGGGAPLAASERAFFEPRFGRGFPDVRIHTGGAADASARSINARAFTLGSDIAFARGEYAPGSTPGRRLMAHELTHVGQQGDATTGKAGLPTNDDKGREIEPVAMEAKDLAHDLRPTVQQETSTNIRLSIRLDIKESIPDGGSALQRKADKSNPPTNIKCDRVDTGSGAPVGTHIDFGRRKRTLIAANIELIAAEFAAWVARGRIDRIIVDGFASSKGRSKTNWRISCNRAEAVKADFVRLGVPTNKLTTIAHGETEEFSATDQLPNNRAVIRIVPTAQPAANPQCPTNVTANTTLTSDCAHGIVIAADNIILDGGGHIITNTSPKRTHGILLERRTGVRIVNCRVTEFVNGISLRSSNANTFTNNSSFRNTSDGFDINGSNNNIFIQNNVGPNSDHGIELDGSRGNRFIQNTVTQNNDGFDTEGPSPRRNGAFAPDNIFIRNNAFENRETGFRILSDGNTITGNSSNKNGEAGFRIEGNKNALRSNTGNRNTRDGFRIEGNENSLTSNTGSNNTRDGFRIEGDENTLRSNTGSNNTRDGFQIEGNKNTLTSNTGSNNTRDGFRIEGDENTLIRNRGSGNQSDDLDAQANAVGNKCRRNRLANTDGQCPTDFP